LSVILLSEALRILHSGATCSLTYVTADYRRGTGGQLLHIPQCVIWTEEAVNRSSASIPESVSEDPKHPPIINHKSSIINHKRPSHYLNKTRNIYIPTSRKIQKLHIKLITQFNGKKVLL
jgi:hypothetical protein